MGFGAFGVVRLLDHMLDVHLIEGLHRPLLSSFSLTEEVGCKEVVHHQFL